MTRTVVPPPVDPAPPLPLPRRRRDERAVAVFGSWMLFGLFLDGWAHQAQKPETFFSPWHGILYSGFVAAVAWFAWDGWRSGSAGAASDRWMTIGLVLFVTGAIGDGVWHEVFGIEVDLEALLSPTHLLLLTGGFLLVTSPLRAALADEDERDPSWSEWWPQALTLTLATALVGFFTMYLSAFEGVAGDHALRPDAEVFQALGIAQVLVTNALLVLPVLLVLRRWRVPSGTFLLLFVVVAVAMSGLEGFRLLELVAPAVLAGATAEVLARRRPVAPVMVAAGVAAAWWASYFLVADATYGVRWTVELWSGTIFLAVASSALFAVLLGPPARRPAE